MPRLSASSSMSSASNQAPLDAIVAMLNEKLEEFKDTSKLQLQAMQEQLKQQQAAQQATSVGIRRKLSDLTNEVGGKRGRAATRDTLKDAGKRHKKEMRKGIMLTNEQSPDQLQKLLDILRTRQKELTQACTHFFFELLFDGNALASVNDVLHMLMVSVLPKLKLADDSFGDDAADFVEYAMEDGALVKATKNLMTCALTNSLLKKSKVLVLKEVDLDATVKPTEADLTKILTLRGMEEDDDEGSIGVLDGSGRSTITIDEDVREVLLLEGCICKRANVYLLSRSNLFGVPSCNEELFDYFPEGHALLKAAQATYETFGVAGSSPTPEVAYDELEAKQRVHLLVLMTAVAMSGVNVVEQKKRGDTDERELVWAPNLSHSQLGTSVLRGIFEFMMDEELCPTTNADIIDVRGSLQ